MRGKWLLVAVLAVAAGVAIGALSQRRRQLSAAPERAGAAVIRSSEASFTGTIRPQHVTSVGASVEGNIEAFAANVGDEVFQEQVLARVGAGGLESERESAARAVELAQERVSKAEAAINSARLEASRAMADAQRARMALDRAEKAYARQRTLHNAGATPKLVFEKAEKEYRAALEESDVMTKAERAATENVRASMEELDAAKKILADRTQQLETAESNMAAAEVRAPVDGLIVGRRGEVGKPASEAGAEMFQIATDIYALEVDAEPPAAVLARIHPGQQALVTVPDLQTGGMPGEVKDLKDGHVTVDFNSTVSAVRPGMRADVRIKLE